MVARVGRRPWRCRCGLPYWWPPVLAAAVAVRRAGVRPWWLVCWLAVRAAGVRPPCWRSVRGWCPSVAVVAVFVAAGGLSAVRRSVGPPWYFRGPWRPVLGLVCLPFQSVVFRRRLWPVAAGVRCWSLRALCAPSAVAVAVSLAVLAGVLVSVSLRRAVARGPCRWPPVLAALLAVLLVVSLRRALLGRVPWPSVRAGVRRGGRWPCPSVLAGVLVCGRWLVSVSCRIPWPWWPVWAVGGVGVRRWSLRPVWALFWALLAGRVGLASGGGGGWRCLRLRWCLPCQRASARAGWRWAVCGTFVVWCPLALLAVLAGVAPAAAVAARLIKGPTPAAAVAALLVVCVTCLRWRRRRWRRWSRPCASRPTCGGRRSACRRCGILKRRRIGWR